MASHDLITIATLLALLYGGSIIAAGHALLYARTAESMIGWVIGLITFPFLALPLYIVFGRRRFEGYVTARRARRPDLSKLVQKLQPYRITAPPAAAEDAADARAIERMAQLPFTAGNRVELLINGEATYAAMHDAIARADEYVIVQFYFIGDDRAGKRLAQLLCERATAGLRVYFLYDEIGCYALSRRYLNRLRAAGVHVRSFHTTKGHRNRFQINFRNHRKIVVVDGVEAFIGGLNIGDDYLGRNPAIGHWRDTHCRIAGPAVQAAQLSFIEDWYWSAEEIPELRWDAAMPAGGTAAVMVLPSGPADPVETWTLALLHTIALARRRLWIATPYFLPGPEIKHPLRLAALRGVDVRILIPMHADHTITHLANQTYVEDLQGLGIRFYRYHNGFMHQKAMLVDDRLATITTANLDPRSQQLNFEVSVMVSDRAFAAQVEAMFEEDFKQSREDEAHGLRQRPLYYRLLARAARIFSPIL